jgi:hypothetical protein
MAEDGGGSHLGASERSDRLLEAGERARGEVAAACGALGRRARILLATRHRAHVLPLRRPCRCRSSEGRLLGVSAALAWGEGLATRGGVAGLGVGRAGQPRRAASQLHPRHQRARHAVCEGGGAAALRAGRLERGGGEGGGGAEGGALDGVLQQRLGRQAQRVELARGVLLLPSQHRRQRRALSAKRGLFEFLLGAVQGREAQEREVTNHKGAPILEPTTKDHTPKRGRAVGCEWLDHWVAEHILLGRGAQGGEACPVPACGRKAAHGRAPEHASMEHRALRCEEGALALHAQPFSTHPAHTRGPLFCGKLR